MAEYLFISDLHCCAEQPEITALFLKFLKQRAVGARALYILGDLFDVWVGDDDPTPPNLEIIAGLKALNESGTPLFIIVGNRDFLLSHDFEQATGAQILADESCLDLFGIPTLLMHGDQLCTDDLQYQQVRLQMRQPEMMEQLLAKSLTERHALAKQYRQISGEATSLLADDIMDVNAEAVEQVMVQYQAKRLIHGHTHRQNIHSLAPEKERIVLGEWHPNQGSVLVVKQDSVTFESYKP